MGETCSGGSKENPFIDCCGENLSGFSLSLIIIISSVRSSSGYHGLIHTRSHFFRFFKSMGLEKSHVHKREKQQSLLTIADVLFQYETAQINIQYHWYIWIDHNTMNDAAVVTVESLPYIMSITRRNTWKTTCTDHVRLIYLLLPSCHIAIG